MSGSGGGGPRGRGPPGGWSPMHFRPPSPYAPSPPPRLPGSPALNMFAARHPYMPAPRPRWPSPTPRPASPSSPLPTGPKPFRMPMHPPSPAPQSYRSTPDYFRGISPYSPPDFGPPSREYEYVGTPLEHPPLPQNYEPDDEDSGPSTAEIIANQSQDYIDEKLAEYQATIYQLQGEYEESFRLRKQ